MTFKVLQSANIGQLKLRNRFIRSATLDATADESGAVTDTSVKIYNDLAAGGVGLIMTGYAFVAKHGQAAIGQYGIHSDEMIPGLKRLVKAVHNHEGKIVAQIVHAGGASSYLVHKGETLLAPSALEGRTPRHALTDDEVEGIIDDFAAAAARAREAGFDGVQLHGAHGYLMSQFFSPTTNMREDRWGGSSENRRRFHVETVKRVRAAVGQDFPVMIKFGIADDVEDGATLEEGIAAIKAMIEAGIEAVEISVGQGSGKNGAIKIFNDEVTEIAYYRERAAAAKREVDIPVAVVGGIRSLQTAEDIVTSGDADFISLCRPFIREPGLIKRWSTGDTQRARCISCSKCLGSTLQGQPLECGENKRIREEKA